MKFLIGLMTAILITGVASAQHGNAPAGNISLGIKGGVNVYNVHNDNDIKYDPRTGYHFGLLGHIHFDNQFAIQPEIVYSAQGAKIGDTKYNLDYVNVPVLFQYMFDNGFRLQAGPQAGFLLSAKSKYNNTTTDNKEDFKPIDLCASIGASYVVPSTGFGIDARYNLGLNNINKNSTVNSTNRGLQLGVFYIFGHNSKNFLK
jgi:Outer membrane protein beta-barrel domain